MGGTQKYVFFPLRFAYHKTQNLKIKNVFLYFDQIKNLITINHKMIKSIRTDRFMRRESNKPNKLLFVYEVSQYTHDSI